MFCIIKIMTQLFVIVKGLKRDKNGGSVIATPKNVS